MEFRDRLIKLRKELNLTQEELAKKIGYTRTAISAWEIGRNEPSNTDTIKLAEYFGVSTDYLLGKSDNRNSDIPVSKIPILGTVKAGYDYLASENIIGYVNLDKNVPNPEEYFALKVTGDSMQPVLYEGDIVIVHSQNDIESGQIGIILINGDEATVKRIVKHDDYIELISFNSYYPPKKITKDIEFKIIGKVVEARISKIFE